MERVFGVVDQIEQAKKFIATDKIPFLRMALLLLDNAAEVLMYRKVENEFLWDDSHKKLFEYAKQSLSGNQFEEWNEKSKINIINAKRKKVILKYFDEKVKFLSEDRTFIKQPVAMVLSSFHRYRNEAYHRDIIRHETIRPVVVVLFEIVCDMLIDLPPSGYGYSSGQDWSEYFLKYEFPDKYLFPKNGLQLISDKLKIGVASDFQSLKADLIMHLKGRIEDMLSNIKFIMTDGWNNNKSLDETLKLIQLFGIVKKVERNEFEEKAMKFTPQFTLSNFKEWKRKADELSIYEDKYDLFNAFSVLEKEFEGLEGIVQDAAIELDGYIQMQIDASLGK